MRENNIVVEHFQFQNYLDFECIKEVNCHGSLRIKGLIADKDAEKYEKMAENELWVSVKVLGEEDDEKIFFRGLLTAWEINQENGDCILSIELHTGSYLLDMEHHIRSFQKAETYSQIIEQCLSDAEGKYIFRNEDQIETDRFFFQYQETDWEFFLRLAGYAGTVLIPDFIVGGKRIYFGYDENKVKEIISDGFKIIRKFEKVNGGKIKIQDTEQDYCVISREIYSLGEMIIFRNQKLVIKKVNTYLKGSELCHEYYLAKPEPTYSSIFHNSNIKGISLLANVIHVKNTKVQICIKRDENKQKSGCRWFDYSTVYSTPDGTGWYCMPEIGDEVRIIFPDTDENNAYVMNSVHLGASGGRENPDYKSWKNRQNKEIIFTPESLILRNNQGLKLELSDQRGILITSDKDIILDAGKDISIMSHGAAISIDADSALTLKQGCAKIDMTDNINICGGKIFMN